MKELSLHILDIAMNSVKAGASLIEITLTEAGGVLTVTVRDDGAGMTPEFLATVTDPFTTTRTTRKVGLGIPLLKLAAEQTGGTFAIESAPGAGTTVTTAFHTGHMDNPPLGDIAGSVMSLIQGSPDIDVVYTHSAPAGEASLDTRVLREALGGIPLESPDVLLWIQQTIEEEERSFQP
ncbi:MAG: ATP-binding protein [Oscillospiraceae bacterium]|jgi:anti-sigma regulatory factor (Ser/Thr protein kinase)|nr:ATP-binding protein [Oscillospiraceae bacterium]